MNEIYKRVIKRAELELKLLKSGFKKLLVEVAENVNESNTVSEIEESIDELYDYLDALKDSERKLNCYITQSEKEKE